MIFYLFQYTHIAAGHVDLFFVVLKVDLIKSKVLPIKLWSGTSSSPEKGKSSAALPHSLTMDPRCLEDTLKFDRHDFKEYSPR